LPQVQISIEFRLTSPNHRAYRSTGGHEREKPGRAGWPATRPSCQTSTPRVRWRGGPSRRMSSRPAARREPRDGTWLRLSSGSVGGRPAGPHQTRHCAGVKPTETAMIRSIGSSSIYRWVARGVPLARSGPDPGALSQQLSALNRRRRLREQQHEVQSGAADYVAFPPYPTRPRPPS